VHTAALAAALVALSMGATAAPIAANWRIDTSEAILSPAVPHSTDAAWDRQRDPILLLSTPDETLLWMAPEAHWEPVLFFPGGPLGEPLEDVAPAPPLPTPELSVGIPESPTVVMSASGFSAGAFMIWRQKARARSKRRRRRLVFRTRAMSATI
jgi:hypothetical protein